MPYKLNAQNLDEVANMIALVESNGDVNAMGDNGKAYGILQIQQAYLTDVNKANGTNHRLIDLLGNRELSYWVFKEYMKIYARADRLGHEPTVEDIARIHNGGPNGYRRASTIEYAKKLFAIIEKIYG